MSTVEYSLYRSDDPAVQAAIERARREVVGKPWKFDPELSQLIYEQLSLSPRERLEQLATGAAFFDSARMRPAKTA